MMNTMGGFTEADMRREVAQQQALSARRRQQAAAREKKRRAEIDAVLYESAMKSIADLFADLANEHNGRTFPVAALLEDADVERRSAVSELLAACSREGGIVIEGESVFVADAEIVCEVVYRKVRCAYAA